MNDLSGLLQNRLLLQYLSAAGQDISAGQPIGANVGAVTNQAITSQSFVKLLTQMLGGEVPEGGKFTMDSKGMKMEIPQSALGTIREGMSRSAISQKTGMWPSDVPTERTPNPFQLAL